MSLHGRPETLSGRMGLSWACVETVTRVPQGCAASCRQSSSDGASVQELALAAAQEAQDLYLAYIAVVMAEREETELTNLCPHGVCSQQRTGRRERMGWPARTFRPRSPRDLSPIRPFESVPEPISIGFAFALIDEHSSCASGSRIG